MGPVGHALTAEAVAKRVRGGCVREAEPHVELLRLVAPSPASGLQPPLTVERVELRELTAEAAGRQRQLDDVREVPLVLVAGDLALAMGHQVSRRTFSCPDLSAP